MVFKILLLVTLHGFFFWCLSNGQACNSLGFICTSCDSLQFCTDGVPQGIVLTCPSDTYCDSTSSSYCTSTECATDPLPYYNCATTGRFAVSTNCSQYIFCSNSTTLGVLVPALYECPNGTVFNPSTAKCVLSSAYDCDGSTTTTTAATTTGGSCTSAGRFPNTTDTTCQSYYFCYLNTDSTYNQTSLTCPTTTVFNEDTQKCVLSTAYTCPY